MSKKCLVTGGCGFIGSNLTKRLLEEGWQVDVIDDMSSGHLELLEPAKFRVVPADLLREFEESNAIVPDGAARVIQGDFSHVHILENISEGLYDVIFHQAAIPRVLFSVENPSITTHNNVSKTVALLEACVSKEKNGTFSSNVNKVVMASSSSVYGGPDLLPICEDVEKNPKSPYAWQKSTLEDCAKIFGNLYGVDIACLRYFNVFGPGQYGDSAYSTAVSAWCNNTRESKPLRSDGDGTQSRDMCYIDNVVDANILAATSDRSFYGRCYNIACGDRVSNNEILDFFKSNFSNVVSVDAPWRAGDVMHTQADITRAKNELGYEPKIRFWEGLEKTITWWGLNEDNEN